MRTAQEPPAGKGRTLLLSERELAQVERAHPHGITSAQVIKIFQSRGIRLSEATFRKYVQLGLLPRSRRVGSKGKHRGSRGIYPTSTVRRLNRIKALIQQSYTIEEIQRSLGRFKEQIDAVESALEELLKGFEREAAAPRFDRTRQRALVREIDLARRTASDLMRRITQIESEMSGPDKAERAAQQGALVHP